jgi:tripartite-type tricarboxylate transporter receptor subunit TctC
MYLVSRAAAVAALTVAIASFAPARFAAADPIADFYGGKTVTIIVAGGVGGGFDLYARTLSQHMSRHIPGHPTVILQFMPGAGGVKGTNYLYGVSPRDGSVMGLPAQTVALFQRIQPGSVRYDAAKFNWVGRMVSATGVLVVWNSAAATTLDQMKTKQVVWGSTGLSNDGYYFPRLMATLLGYNFKIVTGYSGSAPIINAMERRELDAYVYIWASLKTAGASLLAEKKLIPFANYSTETPRDRPDLPLVSNLTDDPDKKAILELFSSIATVGRAFALPPAVPAERVAAMRKAFDETMRDSAFLADAKKRRMDIEPMTGAKVQAVVEKAVATPQAIIDKAQAALK